MQGYPEWVPVTKFFQHGLGEYLKSGGPLSEHEKVFLFDFFDKLTRLEAIKSYVYYLDMVTERDMTEVVRIFNLVNSQGTPLSKADLALSHICSLWPEARQEMREFQKALNQIEFHFDLSFFVRCVSAVATESALFERVYGKSVEEMKNAWQRTTKALEYLINILKFDGHIDNSAALVSDMVLVPLVLLIANGAGKFVNDRQKFDFLHWMYLALMWGRYSGSAETALQQDLDALKGESPTERLRDNILGQRGRTRVEARDLIGASTRTAWSTMAYVVARASDAHDWFNGQPLYKKLNGKSNGLEYHHIFPQKLLYTGKYDSSSPQDRQKVNEIANIAYLTGAGNRETSDKPPAQYLPKVLATYPDALAQQSVPEQQALWELDNFETFLAVRRELLATAINNFLDNLLVKKHPNIPIDDYIAAGEGETVEFKGSLRWDYKQNTINKALEKTIARTIAAFMNSKGGTLIVGVSDEGQALGIEADFDTFHQHKDRDSWEQHLRNVLNNYLSKEVAVLVEASFAEYRGRTVAVLRTEPSTKPVFLTDGAIAEFFVRSGNTTQQLDVKQTMTYVSQHFKQLEAVAN